MVYDFIYLWKMMNMTCNNNDVINDGDGGGGDNGTGDGSDNVTLEPNCNDCPVKSDKNPTTHENLPLGTKWKNTTTGEVFVCTDDTTNKNIWVGQLGTKITPINNNTVDVFGDGSGLYLYPLDGDTNDASGTNNGQGNNIIYIDGKYNQAGSFNGNDSYFYTNCTNSERTTTMWIKPKDVSKNGCFIGDTTSVNAASGNRSNCIWIENNKIKLYYYDGSTHTVTGNINIDQADEYYFITFYLSESNIKVYVNGKLDLDINSSKIVVDGYKYTQYGSGVPNTYVSYFNGDIDQIRVFNRELTEDEITDLYNE